MEKKIQSTNILYDNSEHICFICNNKSKKDLNNILQLTECMHTYHINCLMNNVKNTYNCTTIYGDHYPTYCPCCNKEYKDPRVDFTLYMMTNFRLK